MFTFCNHDFTVYTFTKHYIKKVWQLAIGCLSQRHSTSHPNTLDSLKLSRISFRTGMVQICLPISSWSKHNIEHHQMHDVVSLHPCSFALRVFRCASFVSRLSVTALWTPFHHLCPSYSPFLPSAWLQRWLQDPQLPAVPGPGKNPFYWVIIPTSPFWFSR